MRCGSGGSRSELSTDPGGRPSARRTGDFHASLAPSGAARVVVCKRGTVGRFRAQLLEPRPRSVEVFELEQLASDEPVALEQREGHGEKLERTTFREGAECVADGERTVLCRGEVVHGLDDRVGRLLEQRGDPPDVVVSAIDPTGAGAPVVVEDEVVRQRGTDAVEVAVDQRAPELEVGTRSPARVA